MSSKDQDLLDMMDFIDHAIRYADGGPYVKEDYKKECLAFLENLYDAVLPE